jgi:hypothetical protein
VEGARREKKVFQSVKQNTFTKEIFYANTQHAGTFHDRARNYWPRKDIEGFFEVSKVVESPEMLRGWVEWFKGRNIPCLIEKRKAGYALWRKGNEAGRDRTKSPSRPRREKIVYSFAICANNVLLCPATIETDNDIATGGTKWKILPEPS